jgi:O-methyltransferase
MSWTDGAPSLDAGARRYLDLLRSTLTREIFLDQEWRDVDLNQWPGGRAGIQPTLKRQGWRLVENLDAGGVREEGRDWPPTAETMVGTKRLENVLRCCCKVLETDIPGDFVETGVWRGGVTILMRGVLAAYGVADRTVWAADSFEGLPVPDAERYPADTVDWSHVEPLKVHLDAVRRNFERYDLLDDQVEFLPGWFEDTLPTAPIEEIAVLRLDGDLYQSTMDALDALYPKLAVGGYAIVDDYGGWQQCRQAVDDYRARSAITDPIVPVDWTGVHWQKSASST